MIHKSFRVNIALRVLIIVALAVTDAFVMLQGQLLFAPVAVSLLLVAVVVELIRYIEKSTRDLTHFLLSIRQGGFTETYTAGSRGKNYEALSEAMNQVVAEFSRINLEKELHYQYLQALNENIGVAILSFEPDGKLINMNPAAKRLLNYPAFSRMEHFRLIDLNLHQAVINLQPEKRSVFKALVRENVYQLGLQLKELTLNDKTVRILLIQNLSNELEEKEIDAWHQLMRVLTHEIMNSVTPILSLTTAMRTILHQPDGTPKDLQHLSADSAEDIYNSLATIESRSKGLLGFVRSYKEYSKPVELHAEKTDLAFVTQRVTDLLKGELQQLNIKLKLFVEPGNATVLADLSLTEQTLINVIRNAMEAVKHDGTGEVSIRIIASGSEVRIQVADNGPGIEKENLTRIFVPFFTTKSKGTGIGLSLSKQIMRLHGGNLSVASEPGKGSIFVMEFPALTN